MKQQRMIWLVLLVAAVLAGCGRSAPVRYYTLSPLPEAPQERAATSGPLQRIVTVGPVGLPAYVNRPQVVRRLSAHELDLLDFHHWAEPLADALERLLVENLAILLAGQGVDVVPRQGSAGDAHYRLSLRLVSFDGNMGRGNVVLVGQWRITTIAGGKDLVSRRSRIEKKIRGATVADLVAAQSEALAELSRHMATALQQEIP